MSPSVAAADRPTADDSEEEEEGCMQATEARRRTRTRTFSAGTPAPTRGGLGGAARGSKVARDRRR